MFRLIARLFPGLGSRKTPDTHPELVRARQLLQSGEPDKATQICNQLLATEPALAEACNLLGGIALQHGKNELAIGHFSRAAEIDSNQPSYHQGLGIARCNLRQLPEAIRCFQRALALDPKNPAAHNNLGNVYKQERKFADAKRCYRKSISVARTFIPGYINLADVLAKQHKYAAAVKTYRKALRIRGGAHENKIHSALLHHRLGLALTRLDKTDEAVASYEQAIANQPDFSPAHNSLGGALMARNELDAAIACFRTALEVEPNAANIHSNILLALNYRAESTHEQLFQESLDYDSQHARKWLRGREPFRNSREKKRVLKIGYLSPDFREHSCMHFTRKILGQHNSAEVTTYCYANVEVPDDLTGQFQAQADHWLSIAEMEDDDVAARIRQDGIDILVDLAGHTSFNRLSVFARKPAPIQVNWLGYPNTTGMRVMDYRLTDAVADPPGDADRLHAEKLVRLEHGFLCYQTDESNPAVSSPPCLQKGYVTFGSFNTIKKTTSEVVKVWSRILRSIPDSRLVMKSSALENATTAKNLLQEFHVHGITADRIDLLNALPTRRKHLVTYSRIDIALDPFPYNGATTTIEALWMGVPVVTMRGNRHASRVGASIMHHVGLAELIAENENEYVDLAKTLAHDTQRLAMLRKRIRPQMLESALMNVSLFTATLENAYRKMWVTWCNRKR